MRKIVVAAIASAAVMAAPTGALASAGTSRWLTGAVTSRVDPHFRVLGVDTRAESDHGATGTVTFVHQSPDGVNRFTASVNCLSTRTAGVVEISGSVIRGQTTAGNDLTGRDVAFTVYTASDPQRFSLPRFGDPGTLAPCSGGRPETVPVTVGRFEGGGGS